MEGQCGLPLTNGFSLVRVCISLLHCVCMLEPLGICAHIPEWASLKTPASVTSSRWQWEMNDIALICAF